MARRAWHLIAIGSGITIAPAWAQAQAPGDLPQIPTGREIYAQSCANCHYDGSGNPAAPDLKGSVFWKQDADALIRLLLHGQGGVSVVNGQKFNGQMPPMDNLSNEEIAAVTTYVRATFGGKTEAISPVQVGKLRPAPAPQSP